MGDRMNDKIREEFEAAYVEDMVRIMGEGIRKRAFDNTKFLMQNGEFQDPALRLALWAWRASREALVIELPEPYAVVGDYAACGGDRSVLDVEYAEKITDRMCAKIPVYDRAGLEAAGLKVSP